MRTPIRAVLRVVDLRAIELQAIADRPLDHGMPNAGAAYPCADAIRANVRRARAMMGDVLRLLDLDALHSAAAL